MTSLPLTPRQQQALDAFRVLRAKLGYSPTLEELGAAMDAGPTVASGLLRELVKKGHLRRPIRYVTRGYELAETPDAKTAIKDALKHLDCGEVDEAVVTLRKAI